MSLSSILYLIVCFGNILADTYENDDSDSQKERGYSLCSSYGYVLVEGRFGREVYWLCLKIKPIDSALTTPSSVLFVDPDPDDYQNSIKVFPISAVTMAYGFPVEDPGSGSAEGYIGDDNHFYGVLHLGNRTLHADPYGTDNLDKFFGGFDNDLMPAPRLRREYSQPRIPVPISIPYLIEDTQNRGVARARICDLLLLADKEFFDRDANSSLNHVVRRMMHAVAQADIIFRNSDFDGDGISDNIGFAVKYILVLTSHETNTRVFGNLVTETPIDGREYLMKFARLRRLSEVCLGVAFSGHAFLNRTLGLSFTSLGGGMGGAAGGLCDRRAYGRSFNTLAIAHSTTEAKDRVPERIAALTLAHEIGHSFGAHHDDKFPNQECQGYLMGSQSTTSDSGSYFTFSPCSKRLIATTLSSMSYCLSEERRPYCGNGIVEEGEACDCGLPSRCSQKDPCCTPRAGGALVFDEGTLHKDGCSVAPSAMCHPSQGLCCTPNCQYADLHRSGINCTSQDRECACNNNTCECGLGGRCLEDGSCHAAECAILGLRECQCLQSPGGVLGRFMRCGICCLLNTTDGVECLGAEQAALAILRHTSELPESWPGDDYSGPNLTVTLCNQGLCILATVRAWESGDVCVTRGAVGVCTPSGVCSRMHSPRSNIYPDVMHVKLQSEEKSSAIVSSINKFMITIILLTNSKIVKVYRK